MANSTKHHFYVMVFTADGPLYVTSVNYRDAISYWNKDEAPKKFAMHDADDIALGLCCNGYNAVVIRSHYELECQPYNYKYYKLEFIKKENEDGTK